VLVRALRGDTARCLKQVSLRVGISVFFGKGTEVFSVSINLFSKYIQNLRLHLVLLCK
jgi:hypothetical protein